METSVVYCESEYPDYENGPPKNIIVENALRGVIHEITEAGCVLVEEEKKDDGMGMPTTVTRVSLHIVTDHKTMLDIEKRVTEARLEGMNAAKDIVYKSARIPWEIHVGARFGLECAARDIAEAVKKQASDSRDNEDDAATAKRIIDEKLVKHGYPPTSGKQE